MNVFTNLTLSDTAEYRPILADKNLFKVVSINARTTLNNKFLCKYNGPSFDNIYAVSVSSAF